MIETLGSLTSVDEDRQVAARKLQQRSLFGSPTESKLLLFICLVAIFVRLVALLMVQHWPISATDDLWKSGLEIVNIATSITAHHGFSSPFAVASGPTAWIPPVYPYFIAGVFFMAGLRSNLAAFFILVIQALFSALTCIPIYLMAKKAFNQTIARWASWAWALFPYAVLIPVLFIWETALSALLLSTLCYLCMDLPGSSFKRQVLTAAVWALAALTNTALLALMPFFLLVPYLRKKPRTSLRPVTTTLILFTLLVSPWMLRNSYVLGAVVPVRSNFAEELWLGNHEGGTGRTMFGLSPSDNPLERERYRQLGELAYLQQRKQEAIKFISQHPGSFLRGAFYRFRYWWFAEGESPPVFGLYRLLTLNSLPGMILAWRTGKMEAYLPIIAVIVYPCVYYLTDVYARYRYPVEPFMVLLGAVTAVRLAGLISTRVPKT